MQVRKKSRNIENLHQEALVEWFYRQYPNELLFCIPNQLIRSCEQAIIMSRRGLISGMPDVCVACPRKEYGGLFIELKQPELSNARCRGLTEAQIKVISHLNSRGYLASVAYGVDEAIEMIKEYLDD